MVLMFCPAPPPTLIPTLSITLVCFTSSNIYLCCFMVVHYLKSTKIYNTKIKHKGKYPGDGNALQHCSLLCLNVLQHSVNMLCSIALNLNVLQHLANMFFSIVLNVLQHVANMLCSYVHFLQHLVNMLCSTVPFFATCGHVVNMIWTNEYITTITIIVININEHRFFKKINENNQHIIAFSMKIKNIS